MASDTPPKICRLNHSKLSHVELVFFRRQIKTARPVRFGRPLGTDGPNGATIFSRTRAPVRLLRHADIRRDIVRLSPRYTARSLRRSTTDVSALLECVQKRSFISSLRRIIDVSINSPSLAIKLRLDHVLKDCVDSRFHAETVQNRNEIKEMFQK